MLQVRRTHSSPHRVYCKLSDGDLWVFGYGSLMWKPGFDYTRMERARLYGHRRALCVWSRVHRGDPCRPGLVLGLERGGCCVGRAFRVPRPEREGTLRYLFRRELTTSVYVPRLLPARLQSCLRVAALTFVVDTAYEHYATGLSIEMAAAIVRGAVGISGANLDYVANTVAALKSLGIQRARSV